MDEVQSASARQFDRQSDNYGRKHILADTSDVAEALEGVTLMPEAEALDVATGGGHTALFLARKGLRVTAGDLSERMLANTRKLLAEEGFTCETRIFPAEEIPFADGRFDIVSSRVAPHHFSSVEKFVHESARVLKPGGYFLLIDGSPPDGEPAAAEWLNRVEKWRDPSHERLYSRAEWEALVKASDLEVLKCSLHPRKQPDLEWYFETAATSAENRKKVLEAIRTATPEVRKAVALAEEDGKIVWNWQMITLLARKPA